MEKRFRVYVIAAALVGLLGSVALYFAISQLQNTNLLVQFQRDAKRLALVIEQRLGADAAALKLLDGEGTGLDRQADRLLEGFPDLTGLVWAPAREQGYEVARVYGEIQAEQLIGLDIAGEPDLAGAVGQLGAAPATLFISSMPAAFATDQAGKLLVLAAARQANPEDASGLGGIFAAVIAFERAVDASLVQFGSDDIHLVVSHPSLESQPLYMGGAAAGEHRPGDAYSMLIEPVAGQQWILQVTPTTQYFAARSNELAQLAFFAALLLTVLTTLYLEITLRRADQVKSLIERSTERLNSANKQLELLTLTDDLTGAVNRRGFDQALQSEWGRAKRDKSALTLLMIDIDYFKFYNDHYGHPAGDKCLKKVAQALARVPGRLGDLVARYGGEEFAVILPNTEDLGAVVAERCRAAIHNLQITHEHSEIATVVTVSIGSAMCWPHHQGDPGEVLELADTALYEAKAAGRNRVEPAIQADSAA